MRFASPHIILIDGESGAGKTTLAEIVGDALGATVVHLDDVYPGWGGLVAGRDAAIDSVLRPLTVGRTGSYESWDWERNEPRGTVTVSPCEILVVEGCGISTPASRALADVVVWVDAPRAVRVERLHRRDGTQFDEFMPTWHADVARHIAENDPIGTATVRLNG